MITNPCKTRQSFILEPAQSLRNMNQFSKGVTTLAFEQFGLFMDRAINLAEATIFTPLPAPLGVCDFPEQEPCCPEIAWTLIREVFPGELVIEPVMVRNLGKKDIEFVFETGLMKDFAMNETDISPVPSPHTVMLSPGQNALVQISYETRSFQPGHRYKADMKVKGHCEQTIRLIAHVISPDAVRCTIAQKEHIKARRHDWRDHFYCEPNQAKEQ